MKLYVVTDGPWAGTERFINVISSLLVIGKEMTKGICEFCKQSVERGLTTHHLIPRWCGGKDEDTIEICRKCHVKLETIFENFIKFGTIISPFWENVRKTAKTKRQYYWENREKLLAQRRDFYRLHREEKLKRCRKYIAQKVAKDPEYWKKIYQRNLKRKKVVRV